MKKITNILFNTKWIIFTGTLIILCALLQTRTVLADDTDPDQLKSEISKENMPVIKVSISSKDVTIGELITWKLIAEKKDVDDRVVLDGKYDFGKLEIQDENLNDNNLKNSKNNLTTTLAIGLLSFEAGEFEIPGQKVSIVDKDGKLSEIITKSFSVKVKSLIANEPEPELKKDAGKPFSVIEKDYTLLYIAGAIGIIILIVLLTLVGRKLWSMRKPKSLPPPPPPRPAEIIANEKLNELKKSSYLAEGMHKTYHLKLSETVREYLGGRYDFDSLERSTTELISDLEKQDINREIFMQIVDLLHDTDLVKFAKHIPGDDESTKLLDDAYSMVKSTTPVTSSTSSLEEVDSSNQQNSNAPDLSKDPLEPDHSKWKPKEENEERKQ